MKVEGKIYFNPSKFSVRPISKSVAKDIVVNHHYAGIWTKVSYALGLFYESDEEHQFFSGRRLRVRPQTRRLGPPDVAIDIPHPQIPVPVRRGLC